MEEIITKDLEQSITTNESSLSTISVKRNCENNKILTIFCIICIIVLSAVGIIITLSISRESKTECKNEDEPYELDTISSEEMDKARKSFKQYSYINNSKIIEYNLYIPENISKDELYPLIIFIHDENIIGQEITSPLTKTVGGPIWATDTVQKKHKCYILVPQYNETIITKESKSEYIDITINLIKEIQEKYKNIDKKRIYGTGQSMGAMVTLYFLTNNPELFTAGLIISTNFNINELYGLVNASFTYIVSEGDINSYNGQYELKQYFDEYNVSYNNISNVNAQEKIEILNKEVEIIYEKGSKRNFISYRNGTVVKSNSKEKNEHRASFKYGYRIEAVRDWLFSQSKI